MAVVGGGLTWGSSREAEAILAADGAAGARSVPQVLVERSTAGTSTVRPENSFDFVAVHQETAESTSIRFEYADGFGEWRPLHFHADGRDDLAPAYSALVRAPAETTGYEVRTEGSATVECAAMNLHDGNPVRIEGQAEGELHADGQAADSGRRVAYVTRAGWGADESLRFDDAGNEVWPAESYPVQAITVHHTAWQTSGDYAADVRAVYQLHAVEQAWGDIGYHLLIDPDGRVYEGRHSGDDPLPVFAEPPSPEKAESVTAGHVLQMNSGNIGVCLLGDFTDEMPTRAAQDSLVNVLRTLCRITGVDPTAEVEYVNPVNGATATMQSVSRHRDWLATECPGNTFAEQFDTAVRQRVVAGLR